MRFNPQVTDAALLRNVGFALALATPKGGGRRVYQLKRRVKK
jgi:hypothetical protein